MDRSMRGLLSQYREIPVEDRAARATGIISQIVKAPVQLLSRPARGDNTKLTERLIKKLNSGNADNIRPVSEVKAPEETQAEETEEAGEESEAEKSRWGPGEKISGYKQEEKENEA